MRPGDRFDRFEIVAHIGEGGMGRVFRARDEKLGRDVAIKLLPSGDGSEESRQRMLREARAAAGVTHPHAVAVYDVGEHPEAGPYIVMELVLGEPLRAKLGDASVTESQKVVWLDQVAAALEAAHGTNVVHRDVKPENVVVTKGGAAKVLDFGIAKRAAGAVDPSAPTESKAGGTLSTLTEAGARSGRASGRDRCRRSRRGRSRRGRGSPRRAPSSPLNPRLCHGSSTSAARCES